jgi:hypothetical protein
MTSQPAVMHIFDSLRQHGVKALLMGGHACVAYGASEFTRDVDLVVLPDQSNLEALKRALDELGAVPIEVPPFERHHRLAGHTLHFRCAGGPVDGLRIDVMSTLRGVAPFDDLWARRWELANGVAVLGLADLIRAKKTQRDKDWPMIRRLIEADYVRAQRLEAPAAPKADRVHTWLEECRTPSVLYRLVHEHAGEAAHMTRPAIQAARRGATEAELDSILKVEEDDERQADRTYWAPLRDELERLRQARRRDDR